VTLVQAALYITLSVTYPWWETSAPVPMVLDDITGQIPEESRSGPHDEAFEMVHSALMGSGQTILTQLSINGQVTARIKSAESLRAKANRKGLRPEQILDRFGVRLILHTIEDCYAALQAIRSSYPVIDDSFDDYIATPKPNGYQSIHLAVQTSLGATEFQIRTQAMHHSAEHGPAAHWRYKQRQHA